MTRLPWSWGTTADEDLLVVPARRDSRANLVRATDIEADPPTVFRWLAQLKVAPYSYDWIDNPGRRSPRQLTPGVAGFVVGESVMTIFTVRSVEPDRYVELDIATPLARRLYGPLRVTYQTLPLPEDRTRLVAALHFTEPLSSRWDVVNAWALAWGDLIMMRKQLLTLADLAGTTSRAGAVA